MLLGFLKEGYKKKSIVFDLFVTYLYCLYIKEKFLKLDLDYVIYVKLNEFCIICSNSNHLY